MAEEVVEVQVQVGQVRDGGQDQGQHQRGEEMAPRVLVGEAEASSPEVADRGAQAPGEVAVEATPIRMLTRWVVCISIFRP